MPPPCRRHRDTVPCQCRAWDETEHHLGGGGGADPTRGRSRDPVGREPDFLTDSPHRPTRLSHELEEVDAVRPVPITAIHRLDRTPPGGATMRFVGLDLHKRTLEVCIL